MAGPVLFWHKAPMWTALTPPGAAGTDGSKPAAPQQTAILPTAADNPNVCTLGKAARAAEDSGLDPQLVWFAVVCSLLAKVTLIHTLSCMSHCSLFKGKKMQVLWGKIISINISNLFWNQFLKYFFTWNSHSEDSHYKWTDSCCLKKKKHCFCTSN